MEKHLSVPFLFLILAVPPLDAASEPAPYGTEAVAQRIDIGGRYLSVACLGQGRPTVILDHGLGGSSRDWRHVQRGLASTTRVCSLRPRGIRQQRSRNPGPARAAGSQPSCAPCWTARECPRLTYWLAIRFGGYNVRAFADLFPAETAGLVLLDSPHEEQADRIFQMESRWRISEIAAFAESGRELRSFPKQDKLPVVVMAHGRRALAGGALSDQLEGSRSTTE